MRKNLVTVLALLMVFAIAVPAFAIEVQYGGLFRARLVSSDNITGIEDFDDNQNYIDQRLRMFFKFVASENLQLVTGFEQDVLWGDNRNLVSDTAGLASPIGGKLLTGHRDVVGLELKHAYIDFLMPMTPVRAKIGLQPLALISGWIVDEDFTAAVVETAFDPIKVTAGYVGEVNVDVTTTDDNVDDVFLALGYADRCFSATLVGFYQDSHDAFGLGTDDNLFDLGLALGYKLEWLNLYLNYVQNLGSYDDRITGDSIDYRGFMVEGGANFYWGPWTFSLGGFVTSGDNDVDDTNENFQYPRGRSHYWSEILGLGTLDAAVNASSNAGIFDQPVYSLAAPGYRAGDGPSNLWMVTAGAAWQATETTKLSFNYYYIGTTESVVSGFKVIDPDPIYLIETDDSIGHELDFYLDQKVVDGLMLRLVGAYLFANDAYSIYNDDNNVYEVGARLQWSF